MKKFTLMIVAALMAVTASAQKLDKAQVVRPSSTRTNMVARAMPTKAKPVEPFKLQKKAHKAAGVSSIDDLTGKWMQIYYSYFDETILSTVVEITKTKGSENSITISGWWGSWTEPIEATVDLAAGTVTVAPQLIYEYEGDEPAELVNADSETEGAPLVGTIAEDGSIIFEEGWAAQIIGGTQPYEYALYTMFVRPNGTMSYKNSYGKQSVDVYIEQYTEEEKVYIYNFGDYGRTVELSMNSDKTIEVPSNQVVYNSSNGDFYLYGLDETASSLISLTATGTETTITFDQDWTGYTDSQYWLGQNTGTTITLTDGSTFIYPAEIADVAATPATPTDLVYAETKYGPAMQFDVPRVDTDGNKLRKDKLFYQIYYMIDGKEYAYTLKAADYEYLDSDMDLIPYDFTDDWDIYSEGDTKTVYLYPAAGETWERVGVKSIYQGGGEAHESDIIWYDIETGEVISGISTVKASELNSGKIYNLSGQQVKQGYKGIVIKDGKKFVIK